MELSQELFEQIAGCNQISGDKVIHERRKARRVPLAVRTRLMVLRAGTLGPSITARLRDFSRTGIGFLQSESLAVGDHFVLEVPRRGGKPIWLRAVVARTQPLSPVLFLVGARFEGLLEGHPADSALAASTPPAARSQFSPDELAARLKAQEAREIDRIRESVLS